MKRKILLFALIILLILALAGCEIFPPWCPEELRAGQEVYSYWQAIINRQYELAKWHCITGGFWYNKVDEWEEYININCEGEASVVICLHPFYKQTEVTGDSAIVYTTISADKIPFPDSCATYVDTFEYEIELIKETSPPTDWKLK